MEVEILIQSTLLKGNLDIPDNAKALIIFTQGGESGRHSTVNKLIAEELNMAGYATLLFDLLTEDEEMWPINNFEIELLTERLIGVTKWCIDGESTNGYKIGYFGASTGSAAALSAAAYWGTKIFSVVSRGGRPDLAMEELDLIEAPVLLIVGGEDKEGVDSNRKAYIKIGCIKKMEIVAGATHLFVEEGALKKVADLARSWFDRFLFNETMKERIATVG